MANVRSRRGYVRSRFGQWLTTAMAVTLLLLGVSANAPTARGQGLLSDDELRPLGLETAWSQQVIIDSRREKIAALSQHVSLTNLHTVFEISAGRRHWRVSERDRDVFGKPYGVAGAKNAAFDKAKAIELDPRFAGIKAQIIKHVVPEITLVAATSAGLIQCFDGETGQTLWTTTVGLPIHPTTGVAANDQYVVALNGSKMYVVSRTDGALIWERSLIHTPAAAPAMSRTMAYIPMVNGQIASYAMDQSERDKHPDIYQSRGRLSHSPVVWSDSVAWLSDEGALYVGNANDKGTRFRVESKNPANCMPTFVSPNIVFFAGADGYIYFVDDGTGQVLRRFSMGDALRGQPYAHGDSVFCVTERNGLFCVDATTSQEKWFTGGMESILSVSGGKMYGIDTMGRFTALDAATGRRVGTLKLKMLPKLHRNIQTDRIFATTRSGMIQCLRPIDGRFVVSYEANQDGIIPNQGGKPVVEGVEDPDNPFGDAPAGDEPGAKKPAKDEDEPAGDEEMGADEEDAFGDS